MSANLDVKALSILAKEIAVASSQHALVVYDISKLGRKVANLEAIQAAGRADSFTEYSITAGKIVLSGLLARERQLLEHRDALIAMLRS